MSDAPKTGFNKELIDHLLALAQNLFPVIAVICGAAIWLPDSVTTDLGLNDLRKAYLGWLVAAAVIGFLLWTQRQVGEWYDRYSSIRRIRERVEAKAKGVPLAKFQLEKAIADGSEAELAILQYCIEEQQDVVFLRRHNPIALALVKRGILRTAPEHIVESTIHDIVPFFIEFNVYRAIKERHFSPDSDLIASSEIHRSSVDKIRQSQLTLLENIVLNS